MSDEQQLELEEQEKEEILEEIDQLVSTNRIPITGDMEKLTPQKSGIGFPLLINIFAVAAVLSTFYFSNRLFEQKQENLSIENATYQSAEGKLLQELKKESAAKLEQKEEEIGAIQDELAELDRQSRELVDTMDQQIQAREEELRAALETELEEERRKLRSQGKSETAIEEELQKIEEERSAEYKAELASFRAETEQAIAAKEEELARAKQLNEELLNEVNQEKARIQEETKARESELTEQFEAEKAVLAEEAAAAEAELEQLTANQARESLIIDQINGSYESIFASLYAGNSEDALTQIESLRQLIDDPSIAGLKSVAERSANDKNTLSMLKEKIEEEAYKDDTDTKSLAAAAEMLLSAQEIAGLGTEAYNTGDAETARDYYTRSLQKIPSLRQAWENLELISKTAEADRLSNYIYQGSRLAEQGNPAAAAARFAEAAGAADTLNPALLEEAISGLLNSSEANRSLQLSDKDKAIAALENSSSSKITQLENDLEETKRTSADLLAETNLEWERKFSAAEKEYENKLAAADTENNSKLTDTIEEYESTIADGTADYEAKIAEAKTALADLEIEKNAVIDRLTRLIGEKDQENLKLNIEKEEAAAALAAAEEDIAARSAEIQAFKNQSETDAEQLSSESKTEINLLKEELALIEQKYEELNASFAEEVEILSNRLKTSEISGYNNGIKQGRYEALSDIVDLTTYLDGSETIAPETESLIAQKSQKEAVYGDAVRRIQALAASGGSNTARELVTEKQDILIGSISYASGNQITIEPLTDLNIESGTRITIKRKERGKAETYITFGIITSASESKISARTDPAGTIPARSMDLVYINQ